MMMMMIMMMMMMMMIIIIIVKTREKIIRDAKENVIKRALFQPFFVKGNW